MRVHRCRDPNAALAFAETEWCTRIATGHVLALRVNLPARCGPPRGQRIFCPPVAQLTGTAPDRLQTNHVNNKGPVMTSAHHRRGLELLTLAEVSEILRVCDRTVHRLVERGDLRPSRVGRRVFVTCDEVENFIRRSHR
jgi:excisionase family DNA binding protein